MQVYLATMESLDVTRQAPIEYVDFGLISFYYMKNRDDKMEEVLAKVKYLLVDSGAHSLQHGKGKETDMVKYMDDYVDFISKWTDNEKVVGFFEMDIDNVVGYDQVKRYRDRLEAVSDKIIPVWHRNRGIDEYTRMCEEYTGRRVAVTGFGMEIQDHQLNMFINTAHYYKCNIHLLAMTRFELLRELNIGKNDSIDSSTWRMNAVYGNLSTISKDGNFQRLYALSGLRTLPKASLLENFYIMNKISKLYREYDQSVYFKNGNDERFRI